MRKRVDRGRLPRRRGDGAGGLVRYQAGPYQAVAYPSQPWRPEGDPARKPHEYPREGTAEALTPFHPSDVRARLQGVTAGPDAVPHP